MIVRRLRKAPPQRRFVDRPSSDEIWQLIHRVGDRNYPLFRDIFLDAWNRWRQDIDPVLLFEHLIGGNTGQAAALAEQPWVQVSNRTLGDLQQAILQTIDQTADAVLPGTLQAEGVVPSVGVQLGLNAPANTRVLQFVRLYSADLVTLIGETERAAIRSLILDAATTGQSPIRTAQDIRQFIGLTNPQARALLRQRTLLEAQGVSPERIQTLIERRTRRMIRQRAITIAREESIKAAVQGQYQLWLEHAENGLIDVAVARRFWVVTPDDRLCPICRPIPSMNPKGVRIDEPYATPVGPRLIAHAHITCRCAEKVELRDAA